MLCSRFASCCRDEEEEEAGAEDELLRFMTNALERLYSSVHSFAVKDMVIA